MPTIKQRIGASPDQNSFVAEVGKIVGEQAARVLRLARNVVDEFKDHDGNEPHMKPITAILEAQVPEDSSRQSGLSVLAEVTVGLSALKFAQALIEELHTVPVNLGFLWKYFSSGHGASIVGQSLFEPVSNALEELPQQ